MLRSVFWLTAILALALPAATAAQAPEPVAPPAEPPVAVVPLPGGEDLTPEIVTAVRHAVLAQLQGMVQGREVRALENEQRLVAILECADAPCIGAQLADLGAIAGVLVRIARGERARGRTAPPAPVIVTLEVVDPVSGAPRLDPVQAQIAPEQLEAPAEALSAAIAQLAGAMPVPPPRSSLLVAVNVDDAAVSVDGEEIGRSPIAPVEVPPGRHVIEVTRPGFVSGRQSIDVGRGEDARVDLVLDVDPDNVDLLNADAVPVAGEGGGGPEQPFYTRWYVIAGAGVVLAAILIAVVAVAASGGDDGQGGGVPVPPIE